VSSQNRKTLSIRTTISVIFMAPLTSILVSSSGFSSILSASSAPNAFNTFAQEQIQTASTSGNNTSASTNETAEAASTYNEILNPRQIE
jgi:hypothetical protein